MRRYFWSGTIVTCVVLAGAYAAVNYARRHPDSFMARVATVVYKIGVERNPPGESSQANYFGVSPMERLTAVDQDSAVVSPRKPNEPRLLPDRLPEQPMPVVGQPVEPIRVLPEPSSSPIQRAGFLTPAARNPFPEVLPLAEDVDECPSIMPRCTDDETNAPPMTSPSRGKEGSSSALDFFMGLPLDAYGPCGGLEAAEECYFQELLACPKCPASCEKKGVTPKPQEAAGAEEQENTPKPKARESSSEGINKRLESLLEEYQSPETRPAQRRVDTMEFRPTDARRGEFDPIPF